MTWKISQKTYALVSLTSCTAKSCPSSLSMLGLTVYRRSTSRFDSLSRLIVTLPIATHSSFRCYSIQMQLKCTSWSWARWALTILNHFCSKSLAWSVYLAAPTMNTSKRWSCKSLGSLEKSLLSLSITRILSAKKCLSKPLSFTLKKHTSRWSSRWARFWSDNTRHNYLKISSTHRTACTWAIRSFQN